MEFGKIKSKKNDVKRVIELKLSQIDGFTSSVQDSWEKVKETLFDILNNDTGKMEIVLRKL